MEQQNLPRENKEKNTDFFVNINSFFLASNSICYINYYSLLSIPMISLFFN